MTPKQSKELYGVIRQILVARDGEKCLRCGKTEVLHMSHIYPKGKHRRMEYEPDNLKFLCMGCHLYWWHRSPVEAHEWLEWKLPKARLAKLKLAANTINKTKFDWQEHKILLQEQLKRVKKKSQNTRTQAVQTET